MSGNQSGVDEARPGVLEYAVNHCRDRIEAERGKLRLLRDCGQPRALVLRARVEPRLEELPVGRLFALAAWLTPGGRGPVRGTHKTSILGPLHPYRFTNQARTSSMKTALFLLFLQGSAIVFVH
jgi:hypothetical protein